jgi:hypothetical protein
MRFFLSALILVMFYSCLSFAMAEGIKLRQFSFEPVEKSWTISASYTVELPAELVEAIRKGIPFYFVTELQITRGRWYWFEEKLIQTNKNIRLSYQPLTQQYRISTEGFTYSANSISEALIQIGAIGGWQVADLAVLENGQTYQGAMRMRLDLTKLPKPFQINALNTRDWTVLSDWHQFTITPKARATK